MSVSKGETVVQNSKEKMTNQEMDWQFPFTWTEFYELFDGTPC